MHENVVRLAAAGIVISLMFASGAVCAATNVASAYYLPVERSEGRSFRYWADHPLDQVDTNAEHAVVVVHGVNGGLQDSAGRIRQLLAARRDTSKKWLDVHKEANEQGPNRYERFKNFRDYVATFPQLTGHFRFVSLEGKPHGGACYDNNAFLDLVFGKRE